MEGNSVFNGFVFHMKRTALIVRNSANAGDVAVLCSPFRGGLTVPCVCCTDFGSYELTLSGQLRTIRRRAVPVVRVVVVLRARSVDVPRVVRVAGVRRTQPPVAGRSYNSSPFIQRRQARNSYCRRYAEQL